jgi:hypothetical protein
MSALSVEPPFPAFADAAGQPLEDGYIWIGTVNLNPITNPIVAYWDAGLTITAVQPIRTSGGYPVYQGTPANIYVNSDYSIQVQNKNGTVVYSAPTAPERYSEVVLTGIVTLADLADETDVAKGDALVGYHQANQSGLIPNTYGRTVHDKLQEFVSVFDFMTDAEIQAVKTNSVLDVTTSVQNALDYAESGRGKYLKFPAGDYRVTQITVGRTGNRNASVYDFYAATIVGIGSGTSIVQIKTGGNKIFGLNLGGNQREAYQCGLHWFTNDVNTYYPGFMNLQDISISGCVIGFCIGALPSQAVIPPFSPPAVLPDGEAVDAPVSESFVTNLQINDCITCVYMRQPNGKLSFIQPVLNPRNTAWTPSPATNEGNLSAIRLKRGELNILGGEVLNIESTTGELCSAELATLNIMGTIMESKSPIKISERATVRICNDANWGLNNDSNRFFEVQDSADGELVVNDSHLRRGYGTSSNQPVLRVVNSLGSTSVNDAFIANFENVEFGDSNMTQGGTYNPLVLGCRSVFKNCWYTSHSGSDPYPRIGSVKIDEKDNRLIDEVDLANTTITAYGVNGNASSGGFTFAISAGSPSWGKYTVGLPTIEGLAVSAALRLTATGAGITLQATSTLFGVQPQRPYLLKGWAKTGGSSSIIKIRINYFDFVGSASGIDAQIDLYSGIESGFNQGTVWSPFMLYFVPPADTTQASLNLYAENNADLQVFNLEIM